MKYAREDYNQRIIDTENLIPDDEPVFLFRGQDELAPQVLDFYADLLAEQKRNVELEISAYQIEYTDPETIAELTTQKDNFEEMEFATRRHASKMRLWTAHKLPDIPLQMKLDFEPVIPEGKWPPIGGHD